MRTRRFAVATLQIDGDDVPLRYADIVVAAQDGAEGLDWEMIAMPSDSTALGAGAYRLEAVTHEGRRLAGDAILVRSVDGTHVLRGAGPIGGVADDDLRD